MRKFVKFTALNGKRDIVIQVDRIAYVLCRGDGKGVYIDFGTGVDNGVAIQGDVASVMRELERESDPF